MSISKEFIVTLKGRDYPVFAGVLDAATKAGLRSLTTTVVQIPSGENNHVAVVMARAEFDDGRVFEDVGDASPANCSQQISTAALRMASTRAKGRVLRDACNIGMTLLEEMPDMNGHAASYGAAPAEGAQDAPVDRPRSGTERFQGNGGDSFCESCGLALTASQAVYSRNKFQGAALCPAHQKMAAG